jgi:CubicO group peptidase (beta-lactamase class C family)
MKKVTVLLSTVFMLLLINACLKEDAMKKLFTGFNPVNIGDGWVISTLAAERIDSMALDQVYRDVYADDQSWMMKSLLVFRNCKLIAESYLKDDADRIKIDAIWSCTKQVNSTITGIAINQGYIGSIKDPIGVYLPDYIAKHPDKAAITLEHLLTMKSGIAFDNATQSDIFRQHKTDNSIDYVLGLALNHEPGSFHNYQDGDPQVVSGIIQAATGKPLDEYGKEVLFDPLSITNYKWERYSDGVTLGAFGILTSPRELAKVAECVLDTGRWNNQQIIPIDWWQEMLSAKVTNVSNDAAFGYYWWSIPSKGYYFMWGHGGQYAFIIPTKKLVVVITSFTQVDDDVAMTLEQILDIIDRIAATAQ